MGEVRPVILPGSPSSDYTDSQSKATDPLPVESHKFIGPLHETTPGYMPEEKARAKGGWSELSIMYLEFPGRDFFAYDQ